jgi:outer membrane protein assembly factor BamB
VKKHSRYILSFFILLGLGLMAWWLLNDPSSSFKPSVPGMDNRKKAVPGNGEKVSIGEDFIFYKTAEGIPGTSWPRFRGANSDNICRENIPLISSFGKDGPKILWKLELGDGHAAPAIYDGRVYILDYDEKKKEDALRCFSLKTGEELWRRSYHVHLKRNHGMSRTIPAVTDKYVLTIGPRCQVMCCDRISGALLWGLDLGREFLAEVPFWYTGQCPIILNDTAVIAVGGKTLIIGIDCKTGKKVWETPNPRNWKMSHSSLMPMMLGGQKTLVYCAIGGVCGVVASGPQAGKVLWETTEYAPSVVAPSPVVMDEGRIFAAAGYGAGSVLLQVTSAGNDYKVKVLQKLKPSEGLASEQQTPVYIDSYLYGIQPKDAGATRNQFVCCKGSDCSRFVMSSGKTERFGLGPYILADGKFFILNDDGELTIAKASPAGFKVLDRARIIDGQDSWGPLAITGGYLLMRDSKTMVCVDIKAK